MNKKTTLILKLVGLVMCVLTAVSFFLPVLKTDVEDVDPIRVSSAQVCFLSAEKAEEKAEEAVKDNNEDKVAQYSVIYSLKHKESEARSTIIATSWLHFVAALAGLAGAIVIALSLFGKNYSLVGKIVVLASMVLMVVSLICGCSYLNTEIVSKQTYGDVYNLGSGVIIGLISAVIASVATFLPCLLAKKKSK